MSCVGAFSESSDERCWLLCKALSLPDISMYPILILPLRIHLARGNAIGCSLSIEQFRERILPMMNCYWEQAGIQWFLESIDEKYWPSDGSIDITSVRETILSLKRDPSSGMMMGKDVRRELFLKTLLPDHADHIDSFDIYFFDMIGQESQGCCISEVTHTIIMGHRSTKGYPEPTIRPLDCLAKTCAHELGHALGLGHPRGRCFRDGSPYTRVHGKDNLMNGGEDRKGGGGTKLEEWQIVLVREYAERFLST